MESTFKTRIPDFFEDDEMHLNERKGKNVAQTYGKRMCVSKKKKRKKQSGRRMKERMKNPQPNEQRGE